MKKILAIVLLSLLVFTSACNKEKEPNNQQTDDTKIILPNLNGKSRFEIESIMKDYDVEYKFKFANTIIKHDGELNKFVSFNDGAYKVGDSFPKSETLLIYTTVLPLNPTLCYKLEMPFDYEGKSFINDGIGEVEFMYTSDGDTAWFKDPITGDEFKVRFLGVDTPETHAGEDPWGLAASRYTENKLKNAKSVVLESELDISGKYSKPTTETYGRYLGFVWVDGVLLNLELVELAYTNSTLASTRCPEIYKEYFLQASFNSMATGRRFFGEIDPEYDYENRRFK